MNSQLINLAIKKEDGSMPGERFTFLEGFLWYFVTPVSITLFIWLVVVALENVKKNKANRAPSDVITRIGE